MSKAAKIILVVLCAVAFAGKWASAQEEVQASSAPADDMRQAESTGATMQPARSPFRFSAELRGVFTDNRDATELEKESTFDFYVIPRLSIGINSERGMLDFQYAPAFRYRTNPSDIQNSSELLHSLKLHGDLKATPEIRLRLREDFDYSDDSSVEKDGVTVRENRTYILNQVEGGFNWRFVRWSDVDIYARNMIKRYDRAEVAEDSDRDSTEAGIAVWRQVARNLGLQLIGRMTSYGYQTSANIDRDFDLYFDGLRAEARFSRTFRGSLTLGLENTSYADTRRDSDSSFYGAADVHGDLLPTLHLLMAVTHGVREADVYPFASQDYDQFVSRVAWDVAHVLTLGVNGTYRLSSYDADVAANGAGADDFHNNVRSGDETTVVAGFDATFKLGERLALMLAQTYQDVDSDVYISFTKNTTSISLTASF